MNKPINPAMSEYFRQMNLKRKNRVGGFKDPEVQKRIQAKRRGEDVAQEKKSTDTRGEPMKQL